MALVRLLALLLALVACKGPDGFTVGYEHQWNEFQTIGYEPSTKFGNLDGGQVDSVNMALHWSIGPQPPRPREDWDELRAILIESRRPSEPITNKLTEYGPSLPPHFDPDKPAPMTYLEWYASLSFAAQCVIAALLLTLIVAVIMCRRQIVAVIRLVPPFRSSGGETKRHHKPHKGEGSD
jgi:hypothetical protein